MLTARDATPLDKEQSTIMKSRKPLLTSDIAAARPVGPAPTMRRVVPRVAIRPMLSFDLVEAGLLYRAPQEYAEYVLY